MLKAVRNSRRWLLCIAFCTLLPMAHASTELTAVSPSPAQEDREVTDSRFSPDGLTYCEKADYFINTVREIFCTSAAQPTTLVSITDASISGETVGWWSFVSNTHVAYVAPHEVLGRDDLYVAPVAGDMPPVRLTGFDGPEASLIRAHYLGSHNKIFFVRSIPGQADQVRRSGNTEQRADRRFPVGRTVHGLRHQRRPHHHD